MDNEVTSRFGFWLHKIMVWVLSIQALWTLYLSTRLVVIDLPNSTNLDIHFLINDLIFILFSTLISGSLAMFFSRSHDQRTEFFHSLVGFGAVFLNAWFLRYLSEHNPGSLLLPMIESLIK